jgi:hypothetical protein
MPWFKVDDQLAFHPKAIAAGNAALGLWVRAGSWCGAHLTEGALPQHMIGTLGAQRRDAERLVAAGLWERTECGYQFKGWTEYQPTKEQVEAKREADRVRQSRRRKGVSHAVTPDVTPDVTNDVSPNAPTRPDPTSTKEETSSLLMPPAERSASEPKAHRLPDDWEPGDAGLTYARERGIDATRIEDVVANFRDHWHNKPGKDGRKLDWHRAWQQWVRNDAEWATKRGGNGNGGGSYPTAPDTRPGPMTGEQIKAARAAEWQRTQEMIARLDAKAGQQ